MVVRQSRQTSWWVLPCVRLTSICKSPTSSTLCTKCRIFLLKYCVKNQNQPCTSSIQSSKTMILLWSNCFRERHWNLWHHSCCHVRSFLGALTRITWSWLSYYLDQWTVLNLEHHQSFRQGMRSLVKKLIGKTGHKQWAKWEWLPLQIVQPRVTFCEKLKNYEVIGLFANLAVWPSH